MKPKQYKYPIKSDCKFCKGTGLNKKNKKLDCICRFVDHNMSDEIGTSLAQFAKRELKKMRKNP